MSDEELLAKLDEMTEHMRYMWWIHGHINFVLLSSSAFCDLYAEVMQPDDPTEAYQALQGFHTRSVDASRGMWELRNIAKASPTLTELFENNDPKQVAAKLEDSEDGRGVQGQARRVPARVRLAQRRGVRPRRRPVARGPVDRALQHRLVHGPPRQRWLPRSSTSVASSSARS